MAKNRYIQLFAVLAFTVACGTTIPAPVSAGTDADSSFAKFCQTWMGKLAKRERNNVNKARPRQNGSNWLIEYVSYAKQPLRCEAKATGVSSNPFIGKMVYTENQVRKAGATRTAAKKAKARVISQTEVMEIFRFDGSRWVY